MDQTLKNRYDYYVYQMTLLRPLISKLTERCALFRRKCEQNIFVHLFNLRRLKKLHASMQDLYSSFDELNQKRTFLWGMLSSAYTIDDVVYVSKQFDHVYENMSGLDHRVQQVDKFLKTIEKK